MGAACKEKSHSIGSKHTKTAGCHYRANYGRAAEATSCAFWSPRCVAFTRRMENEAARGIYITWLRFVFLVSRFCFDELDDPSQRLIELRGIFAAGLCKVGTAST